jgi:hypothetical protein
MKRRSIPEEYILIIKSLLADRRTHLKFDDFVSEPIPVRNGILQGDPISMVLFLFYNADLLEVTEGKDNVSIAFVDDTTLLVIGPNFRACHRALKHLMEKAGGIYEWERNHNAKWELSKSALIDFSRKREDDPNNPGKRRVVQGNPLHLRDTVIKPTEHTRLLGVLIDRELRWNHHLKYAVGKGMKWTLQLKRLTRPSTGISPGLMGRLYLGVALPKMTYAASVWYTPPFKNEHSLHRLGNVGFAKALGRVQRVAVIAITGAMKTMATDVAELHANLMPIDLLLEKECHNAWLRIATLPAEHPIHKIAEYSNKRFVQRHRSPLHFLAQIFPIGFEQMECINTTRGPPASAPTFGTYIALTREESRTLHANNTATTQVFSDGSLKDGKVGTAAVIIHSDRPGYRAVRYHLGSEK